MEDLICHMHDNVLLISCGVLVAGYNYILCGAFVTG